MCHLPADPDRDGVGVDVEAAEQDEDDGNARGGRHGDLLVAAGGADADSQALGRHGLQEHQEEEKEILFGARVQVGLQPKRSTCLVSNGQVES